MRYSASSEDLTTVRRGIGCIFLDIICNIPLAMSVVVGVMTAPYHFDRRFWMRKLIQQNMVFYVLGSSSCYKNSHFQYLFLRDENNTYRDIVSVGGPECNKLATVVKTRNWFEHALRYGTDWIAKTDDDVVWESLQIHERTTYIKTQNRLSRSHEVANVRPQH